MSIWHSLYAPVACIRCGASQNSQFNLYHDNFFSETVRDDVCLGESLGQNAGMLEWLPLRHHEPKAPTLLLLDEWRCAHCYVGDCSYQTWAIITFTYEQIQRSKKDVSPFLIFSAVEIAPAVESTLDRADQSTYWALHPFLCTPPPYDLKYNPNAIQAVMDEVRTRLKSRQMPEGWE